MHFFKSLWQSLYDIEYYHTQGQQYTFWGVVRRYTRLTFLALCILSIIGIVLFSHVFTKKNIINVTNSTKDIVTQLYPTGLVLNISAESGVTTNSTGPTIISMSSIKNILSGNTFITNKENRNTQYEDYDNFLVIDTATTGSIESFNTMMLLNNNELIVQSNKNEKRIYEVAQAMKGIDTIHISPEIVENKMQNLTNSIENNMGLIIKSIYVLIAVSFLVILLIGSCFVGFFTAINIYLYTYIVWILSKILKTKYTYKQLYSMSAIAYSIPFFLFFASIGIKLLILCIIIGRIIYMKKNR